MIKKLKGKLNNSGSTLVLAMIIIAFLSVLATVMLNIAVANKTMKLTANKSKVTFYSAEAAVDEIYAGLGMTSMNSLSVAYVEVASTLVEVTEVAGVPVAIEINNDVANERLKEYFIDDLFYEITDGKKSSKGENSVEVGMNTEEDKMIMNAVKEYLTEFLTNDEAASIENIAKIKVEKESITGDDVYSVTFENLEIRYLTKDGYFATVTVDAKIEFPDVTAGFAKEDGKLTAFAEYALIASGNINFTGDDVIVGNHVLANRNINIHNKSKVTFNGGGYLNVVAGGDINVESDGNGAANLIVNGSDIWCKNVTLKTTAGTSGPSLKVDGNSNTYVKDDLSLNGLNSTATIGGNYYGYSYQGYTTGGGNLQDNSSAIIVNGKNSKLSLEASNILVGGHAYINFSQTGVEAYMTGESFSIKGNQEIYLLTDKYFIGTDMSGKPVQNPMTYEDWMKISADDSIVPIDTAKMEKEFFAWKYLDADKPFIKKYVSEQSMYYVYLNFKTKTDASKYFMTVINDSYFKANFSRATNAQKEERNALKTIMNENLVNMLGGEQSIKIGSGAHIMSSGALFEVSSKNSIVESLVGDGFEWADSPNYEDYVADKNVEFNSPTASIPEVSIGGTEGYDGFILSSINYSNRFNLLTHLCLDIQEKKNGKDYIVYDPMSTFIYNGAEYNATTTNLSLNAADNAVDYEEIKNNPYNKEFITVGGALVTAVDGTVNVPNAVNKGVILATGDVNVSADFSGIIITQGNINVSGSAEITNSALNTIPGYENILPYLYAYRNIEENNGSIAEITYKDIVKLSNWRKNEE